MNFKSYYRIPVNTVSLRGVQVIIWYHRYQSIVCRMSETEESRIRIRYLLTPMFVLWYMTYDMWYVHMIYVIYLGLFYFKFTNYFRSCTASREHLLYTLEVPKNHVQSALPFLTGMAFNQSFRPWEIGDVMPRLEYELLCLGEQPDKRMSDITYPLHSSLL